VRATFWIHCRSGGIFAYREKPSQRAMAERETGDAVWLSRRDYVLANLTGVQMKPGELAEVELRRVKR
jgi:hypothetical protein